MQTWHLAVRTLRQPGRAHADRMVSCVMRCGERPCLHALVRAAGGAARAAWHEKHLPSHASARRLVAERVVPWAESGYPASPCARRDVGDEATRRARSPARRGTGGAWGLGSRARRPRAGGSGRVCGRTQGNWGDGLEQLFWLRGRSSRSDGYHRVIKRARRASTLVLLESDGRDLLFTAAWTGESVKP